MRIGFDIDGVLADFNAGFINRILRVTGIDLFPPRPFNVPTWDYPQSYGYTEEQVHAVWEDIRADCTFWQRLPDYPYTQKTLLALERLGRAGNDIYFITSRPGVVAKAQTEQWLRSAGLNWMEPTVLISSAKGLCARALQLDAYLDDRWENCLDVFITSTATQVFILDQPWNQGHLHSAIQRIAAPLDMLDAFSLSTTPA